MAIGLLWIPSNLSINAGNHTCYTINNISLRDDIKYDIGIEHKSNDYSLLERWKGTCRQLDVYMMIYNSYYNSFEYYLFRRALPNAIGMGNWGPQLTITCSRCNVERLNVLPDYLNPAAEMGIVLGAARRDSYL